MKKTLPLFIFVLAISGISASAQQRSLSGHIPPGASAVYEINLPVLTAKVSWQEIVRNFPNKKNDSASNHMMKLMNDPSLAGIDMSQDIVFAKNSDGPAVNANYTTFIGHITDPEKFGDALLKTKPGLKVIISRNKNREIRDNRTCVSWNDKFFAIVSVQPVGSGRTPLRDSLSGKNGNPRNSGKNSSIDYSILAAKKSEAVLKGFDNSFYQSDKDFRAVFADNADIHIWAEQPSTLGLLKSMNPANLLPLMREFYDSSYKHANRLLASVWFASGRITVDSKNYIAPSLTAIQQKLNGRPVSMDLINKIPHDHVLGFFALSFDPTVIIDILGNGSARQKIDSALDAKNMKLDDIVRVFRGDFLLVAAAPEKTDSAQKARVKVYFGATINDRESLSKLIAEIKNAKDSSGKQTGKNPFDNLKMAYNENQNILGLSGTQEGAETFVKGEQITTSDLFTEKMKRNSLNIVVDFRTLKDFLNSGRGDISPKLKSLAGLMQILDKLVITRGAYDNNIAESHLELEMADKSENSLRTLLKLLKGGK